MSILSAFHYDPVEAFATRDVFGQITKVVYLQEDECGELVPENADRGYSQRLLGECIDSEPDERLLASGRMAARLAIIPDQLPLDVPLEILYAEEKQILRARLWHRWQEGVDPLDLAAHIEVYAGRRATVVDLFPSQPFLRGFLEGWVQRYVPVQQDPGASRVKEVRRQLKRAGSTAFALLIATPAFFLLPEEERTGIIDELHAHRERGGLTLVIHNQTHFASNLRWRPKGYPAAFHRGRYGITDDLADARAIASSSHFTSGYMVGWEGCPSMLEPLLRPALSDLILRVRGYDKQLLRLSHKLPRQARRSLRRHMTQLQRCTSAARARSLAARASRLIDQAVRQVMDPVFTAFRAGAYAPGCPKMIQIPKQKGGVREVAMFRLTDRLLLKALQIRLLPILCPTLEIAAVGCVPGVSLDNILCEVEHALAQPSRIAFTADIHNCFPSVDHTALRAVLCKRLGAFGELVFQASVCVGMPGIPQGSPLSPLLLNVLLDERLDRSVMNAVPFYRRFVDDIIMVGSKEEVALGRKRLRDQLRRLKMSLAPGKTALRAQAPVDYLNFGLGGARRELSAERIAYLENISGHLSPSSISAIGKFYSRLLEPDVWSRQVFASLNPLYKKLTEGSLGGSSAIAESPKTPQAIPGTLLRRLRDEWKHVHSGGWLPVEHKYVHQWKWYYRGTC